MTIRYTICRTPIGKMLLARSASGLCAVRIRESEDGLEKYVRSAFGDAGIERDDAALAALRKAMLRLIAGKPAAAEMPVDLAGTDFQKSVWRQMRRIPAGSTRSYGDIARAIGKPRATRAVAQACGANPIPVLIPCHRVIQSDGRLGGYTGGVHIKKALLEAEGCLPAR